ncbi:MAG: hypothetical protein ACTSXV_00565 [Alphaproteobacteria bacterium]
MNSKDIFVFSFSIEAQKLVHLNNGLLNLTSVYTKVLCWEYDGGISNESKIPVYSDGFYEVGKAEWRIEPTLLKTNTRNIKSLKLHKVGILKKDFSLFGLKFFSGSGVFADERGNLFLQQVFYSEILWKTIKLEEEEKENKKWH